MKKVNSITESEKVTEIKDGQPEYIIYYYINFKKYKDNSSLEKWAEHLYKHLENEPKN